VCHEINYVFSNAVKHFSAKSGGREQNLMLATRR
jgi:hypothetical protein